MAFLAACAIANCENPERPIERFKYSQRFFWRGGRGSLKPATDEAVVVHALCLEFLNTIQKWFGQHRHQLSSRGIVTVGVVIV
jgi:hypothetical protein